MTTTNPSNTQTTATTSYSAVILADKPLAYWRLGETSGTVAMDAASNGNNGVYRNDCTLGQPSSLSKDSDNSVLFSAQKGNYISVGKQYNNPQDFTLEIRFKTTTPQRQSLFGFTDQIELAANAFDREFYLNDSGNLCWMIYSAHSTIASPNSYNDGKWHSAVATCGTDGSRAIYVDGKSVMSVNYPGEMPASYTGYWHIGWSREYGYFDGFLDEAAIYDRVLSSDKIQAHFAAV